MSLDPIAFGRLAARTTLAQDGRRHLTALPGGATTPRHVVNLHPSMQPADAPPLFDREHDDDERPDLPLLITTALSLLTRGVMVPGSVPRPEHVKAATDVVMWVQGGRVGSADDCNPHGDPRPGGA